MIPQIVHQIWYNFSDWGRVQPLPTKYLTLRETWVKQNPGWECVIWNERQSEHLLSAFYPQFLRKFQRFKTPIQKADFFRFVLLWHFGGCYADMDCVCTSSLDTFLKSYSETVLIIPKSAWATNACLIASPRHPAVWDVIQSMPTDHAWLGSRSVAGVFFTSGPSFVRSKLRNHSNVFVDQKLLWHEPDGAQPFETLAVHKGDGNWDFNQLLVLDIIRLLIVVLVPLLLLALFFTLYHRSSPIIRAY